MNTKKTLIILFILLAIAAGVLFWQKNKAQAAGPGVIQEPKQPGGTQPPAHQVSSPFPLKNGSRGKGVQMLQIIVGTKPDGYWGINTDKAIKKLKTATPDVVTYEEFLKFTNAPDGAPFPLKTGSTGNFVKAVQVMLDLTIDGKFGPKTLAAVEQATGDQEVTAAEFEKLIEEHISQ